MAAWTEEELKKLKRLTVEGFSSAEISTILEGRTRNAIIGKWHRLGISPGYKESTNKSRQKLIKAAQRREKEVNPRVLWPIVPVPQICDDPPRKPDVKPMPMDISDKPGDDAPEPLNLELLELTDHMCRWPVNNGDPFLFCGHKKGKDGPYCPYHQSISIRKFVPHCKKFSNAA